MGDTKTQTNIRFPISCPFNIYVFSMCLALHSHFQPHYPTISHEVSFQNHFLLEQSKYGNLSRTNTKSHIFTALAELYSSSADHAGILNFELESFRTSVTQSRWPVSSWPAVTGEGKKPWCFNRLLATSWSWLPIRSWQAINDCGEAWICSNRNRSHYK